MRPIETKYKGCRFRSRLEARWAVFFDTLGLKWWYEPEGFDLYFDYEEFAKDWDFTEEELLEEGIPQAFKALDGKEYSYLPDFYLPELNYWIEVKGPNPTKAELLKAFFLSNFVHDAATAKLHEAVTDKDQEKAWNDLINGGVYVFYGDIPWPYPERGNAVGYGVGGATSGGTVFGPERLYAWLGLCWQQCRLCLKIGIDSLGATYCRGCKFELEKTIYSRSRMTEAIGQELADVKREGRLLDELDDLVKDLPPEDRSSTLEALPLFSNDSEKRVIRETLKRLV